MNSRLRFPTFAAGVLAAAGIHAQPSPAPELPPFPERITYTLTFIRPPAKPETEPGDTAKKAPPFGWQEPMEPESIEVTRVGGNRFARIVDQKKHTHTYWIRSDHALVPTPDGIFIVHAVSENTPPHAYYSHGFFGAELALPSNYQGLVDVGPGGKRHHFKGALPIQSAPPPPPEAQPVLTAPPTADPPQAELWLDPDTLRPVAWQQGDLRVEITYRTSPAAIPPLPAEAEKAWAQFSREFSILQKMQMN